MNTKTPTKSYTAKDLYEFFEKDFPEFTTFSISITEHMNGENKTKIHTTSDSKEIMKIITKQAKDYNLYSEPIAYFRVLFIDGYTLVIDFGSWRYFGKVKVEYPYE